MNNLFLDLITEKGEKNNITGKTPFFINEPANAWFITKGEIDVFAVKNNYQARDCVRHYLFSLKQNDLLFGLDLDRYKTEYNLLAAGVLNTQVIKFNLKDIYKILSRNMEAFKEFYSIVYDFILKMDYIFKPVRTKPVDILIKPDFKFLEIESEKYAAAEEMIWIQPERGRFIYCDYEDIVISESDSFFLPVADGLFLKTLENTKIYIKASNEIDNSLDFKFLEILKIAYIKWVEKEIEKKALEENNKIIRSSKLDKKIKLQTFSNLINLMEPRCAETEDITEENLIYKTLDRIGIYSGIKFKKPDNQKTENIEEICRNSKIPVRKVKLKSNWQNSDNGILLGFYKEDNIPVALIPFKGNRYKIYNSKEDSIKIGTTIEIDKIKENAYMFYPRLPDDRPLKLIDFIKYYYRFLLKDFSIIVFISIISGIFSIIFPFATGLIFNYIIPSSEKPMLFYIVLALVIANIANVVFSLTNAIALIRIQGRWGSLLQAGIFHRLISLPVNFFRKFSVGDLTTRLQGIDTLREFISGTAITTIIAGVMSIFQFIVLFYYSIKLSFVAVGISFVYLLSILIFSLISLRYEKQLKEIEGKITGKLFELINGIAKIKISGSEIRAFSVWSNDFTKLCRTNFTAGIYRYRALIVNSMIYGLSSFIIFYMVHYLSKGPDGITISVGEFIAFTAAFSIFINSTSNLVDTGINFINLIPTINRIKPIIEAVPEVSSIKPQINNYQGRIEASNISFSYDKESDLVLDSVSFNAAPGEFIAFVGPSGSGKSSLIRILLGFEKADTGNIYLDNREINSIDLLSFRKQIGVVLQTSRLFAGSIYENIVGSLNLSIEDAMEAAKKAGLEKDIAGFPMGLFTVLSEGGSTLSGGQIQRILIARALARNPKLLIFDEATSALDNRTQAIVTENINKLNITRIVVAHRLSTIKNADRIYVLDKGRIIQQGNFKYLIKQQGLFKELAMRQLV